jgi:hypothetical protein
MVKSFRFPLVQKLSGLEGRGTEDRKMSLRAAPLASHTVSQPYSVYVLAGRRASRLLKRGWSFFRPERNKSFDILPGSRQVAEQL